MRYALVIGTISSVLWLAGCSSKMKSPDSIQSPSEAGANLNPEIGDPYTIKPVPPYGTPGTALDEQKIETLPGNDIPEYPLESRLHKEEGKVLIRAYLKPDGTLEQVGIEKSSGFKLLDEAGMKTFSGWRYRPGKPGWIIKPFVFSIKNK